MMASCLEETWIPRGKTYLDLYLKTKVFYTITSIVQIVGIQ